MAKIVAKGEAFFVKRNVKGNVVGDYVVADGISIVCAAGTKKAGQPIKSQHFAVSKDFDKHLKARQIVEAPVVEDKK